MSREVTDGNLLFGVLALQADFLDAGRFAEACSAWAARKDTSLAALLLERGWITALDKAAVDYLVQRKLAKHSGDVQASLAEAAGPEAQHVLASLDDVDIQQSLADLPRHAEVGSPSTIAYEPVGRERYQVKRLHARGGIGQVWLACDNDLGRDVALKELRPDRMTPAILARFVDEARITGQLEHPGIVPVYELVQPSEGDKPFYTMRFVAGRTLTQTINSYHQKRIAGDTGPLELRQLLDGFVAVCNAVAYAHSRGVLHRDLKGQNVMLGDFGEVMVLDWGLAKKLKLSQRQPTTMEDEGRSPPPENDANSAPGGAARVDTDGRNETVQGQVLGTPAYMSPEQAAGRHAELGSATDVYSLGAILYEILTGQPPFTAKDSQELLDKVIHEAPIRPRALVSSVPGALEAVCMKALSKLPAERYATATALAHDVRHWQADESVTAYAEPIVTRLGRWGRRHRSLMAAVAGLLLATVAGLSLGNFLLGRANAQIETERETARTQRDLARTNFRLARRTVDDYFNKVSKDKLLQSPLPGLQPLRKELLRLALDYYQAFVAEHQDDPDLQKDLAAAYLRMGLISAEIDTVEKALDLDEKGMRLLQQLAESNPDDVETQRRLGNGYNQLGDHRMRIGRDAEALANLEKAVAIHEALLKAQPTDAIASYDLAGALHTLGLYYANRLKSGEALAAYKKAAALLEKLHLAADDHERLRTLSQINTNIGVVYVHHVDASKAIPHLQQALEIQDELAAKGLAEPENERIRSQIHYNLGLAHADLQVDAKARQHFDKMIAVGEKVARENPTVASYPATLALGIWDRPWRRRRNLVPMQVCRKKEGLATEKYRAMADSDTASLDETKAVYWHYQVREPQHLMLSHVGLN
jgi:serine/threonine-protein kinase